VNVLTDVCRNLDNHILMDQPIQPGSAPLAPYVVVAGYGLPGRMLVELLSHGKIEHVVVELNAQTCQRAGAGGVRMISGSAADPAVLHLAEVERASLVALMVPNDEIVLAAVTQVRRLNSSAHIIARCSFTSSGLEAVKRGANQSIVAEQVIARELEFLTKSLFPDLREAGKRPE
jgi:voltage-gated potassium channel Kch